jgi:hypothetical protein
MPKSRLSAFLSLLLVFVSGAVVGAFAHRLYMVSSVMGTGTNAVRPPRPTPEEFRKRQLQEMRDVVKIDDNQAAQVNEILDQTQQKFDQIHKQLNKEGNTLWQDQRARVKAILRPDQVTLYDQMLAKHDAERKVRQQREHSDHPEKK